MQENISQAVKLNAHTVNVALTTDRHYRHRTHIKKSEIEVNSLCSDARR